MSCGNHHDVDCREILERVYAFIDNELDNADCQAISAHLAECAPCLHAVDLERMVKALVARSCTERAPVQLRERVLVSIRDVQVSFGPSHPGGGLEWARVESSQVEMTQQFNTRPELPGPLA
ncbi:MAG: mycothiol system anti-sigma-R factor [Nocardioidaceae bacterium]|nr:mycothiol system anti-sigma-R factor [Nocardioidaceae bacterium]